MIRLWVAVAVIAFSVGCSKWREPDPPSMVKTPVKQVVPQAEPPTDQLDVPTEQVSRVEISEQDRESVRIMSSFPPMPLRVATQGAGIYHRVFCPYAKRALVTHGPTMRIDYWTRQEVEASNKSGDFFCRAAHFDCTLDPQLFAASADDPCGCELPRASYALDPLLNQIPSNYVVCSLDGYLATWVDPMNCPLNQGGVMSVTGGGPFNIVFSTLNEINGFLGDGNGDGDCTLEDYLFFHACWTDQGGTATQPCQCAFDWDADGDIDLDDFNNYINAIGSGNTFWVSNNYPGAQINPTIALPLRVGTDGAGLYHREDCPSVNNSWMVHGIDKRVDFYDWDQIEKTGRQPDTVVCNAGTRFDPTGAGAGAGGTPTTNPGGSASAFQGFGSLTNGGAGGEIYTVSSLADSGPGTLRDGIQNRNHDVAGAAIPREVVFTVGGDITLLSDIVIQEPYLTLDGSTAPAPGITIRKTSFTDGEVKIRGTHDLIITHLRFHGLYVTGGPSLNSAATLTIFGDAGPDNVAKNIVIDHNVFRNGTDASPDLRGNISNLTYSWNFVFNNRHPTSISFDCNSGDTACINSQLRENISFHHNVYAKNHERQPKVRGGVQKLDFVNNVLYQWSEGATWGYGVRIENRPNEPQSSQNIINNYFLSTLMSNSGLVYGSNPGGDSWDNGPGCGQTQQGDIVTTSGMGPIYTFGNILPPENCDQYSTISAPLPIPQQFQVTAMAAQDLCHLVVPEVGLVVKTPEELALISEMQQQMGCTSG